MAAARSKPRAHSARCSCLLQLVEEEVRRETEKERAAEERLGDVDTDDENDEEEYEAWKVRELRRVKRDRDEREA